MKTLQLWVLPNNDYQTVATLREILRDFTRENPDLKVEVTVNTLSGLWRRLLQTVKRPEENPKPDLVEIPGSWTASLASLGILEDLADHDAKLGLERWLPILHDNCMGHDGRRPHSLPWWIEVQVLYFRRDLLKGLKVDGVRDLKTWSDLKACCAAVQRQHGREGITPIANPNPKESASLRDIAPLVWSLGGDFFSRDGRRSIFQREEAIKGVSEYLELCLQGYMPLSGRTGQVYRDLFEGSSAFQLSGRFPRLDRLDPQSPEYLPKVARHLGAAPYPAAAGNRPSVPLVSSHHLALLRDTRQTREAMLLLRYLTDLPKQEMYAKVIGALPPFAQGIEDAFRGYEEFGRVFQSSLEGGRTLPHQPYLGTLEMIFDKMMVSLIRAVLRRTYTPELLRQEMIYAAAEMDYVLSLYAA